MFIIIYYYCFQFAVETVQCQTRLTDVCGQTVPKSWPGSSECPITKNLWTSLILVHLKLSDDRSWLRLIAATSWQSSDRHRGARSLSRLRRWTTWHHGITAVWKQEAPLPRLSLKYGGNPEKLTLAGFELGPVVQQPAGYYSATE